MALDSLNVTNPSANAVTQFSSTPKPFCWAFISAPTTNTGYVRVFGASSAAAVPSTPPSTGGFVLYPGGTLPIMPIGGVPSPYDMLLTFAVFEVAGERLDVLYCQL